MKYVFLVLLCLCVIVAGRLVAARYQSQMKRCEAFLLFLSFTKTELRFSQCTVLEIAQKFRHLHPGALPFLEDLSEPVSACVKRQLEQEHILSARQKSCICDFFEGFGTQDTFASEQFTEQYIALFEAENARIRQENTKKIKLTNRLVLLLAAAVAIVLF
ncbi:MAG: hypothetical protein IJI67_05645 [Clostridia bacterium]|nr:hypothetical protein [Clostridia bacterium]